MDDSTRKNSPDDQDQNPQVPQSGASSTEFTQPSAASREQDKRKKYEYAIPRSDPLDQTLEGRAAGPQQPQQQPASQTTRPTSPTIPNPLPVVPSPQSQSQGQPQSQQPSIAAVAPRMPPPRPAPRPNYLLAVAVMALFGGGLVLSVALFIVLRIASSANNGPQIPGAVTATAAPVAVAGLPTNTPAPSPTVGVDIQPWDGSQRLTILLLGLDKRPWEKGTAFRTDVMMLISIDPKTKSIGMLSIPRDLFVTLPANTVVGNSYGLQRINSAYTIGELVKPGYGPELAMQTVQYNLGMRINDYMVFEFNTVINAIDDIGGVDINVPYTINDPQYPDMYDGYDPLYIPAGMTHMNGQLALKYARTRHQTSDFDRVKRQQQVMLAARDRILSANMIPTLVTRAPDLWHQLSQTMHSDLTFDQLLRLALYAKDVQTQNIHQGVLDANYSSPTVYQGADVLVPERARIGPLLQQVFGANYNG